MLVYLCVLARFEKSNFRIFTVLFIQLSPVLVISQCIKTEFFVNFSKFSFVYKNFYIIFFQLNRKYICRVQHLARAGEYLGEIEKRENADIKILFTELYHLLSNVKFLNPDFLKLINCEGPTFKYIFIDTSTVYFSNKPFAEI